MFKVILVAMLLTSFSAFAYTQNKESVKLEKSFWCAAVLGDETIDFSVLVTKKDANLFISFPKGTYNLKKMTTSQNVADILSSDKSLFLTDTSVEIDELKCEETSLKQLLAYKKSQELNLE
jgi:hypothetical protein